jgi:hypothetical protein
MPADRLGRPPRLQAWAERIAAHWPDDEDVFVDRNDNDPGCAGAVEW